MLIAAAALLAAFSTILLQRRQNTTLVREITALREEKARVEAQAAAALASPPEESAQRRLQELESEITRLRGVAGRVAGAETEAAQLRTELQRQRAGQSRGGAESTASNPDTLAEYIGVSVAPPANLDPAYTRQGLAGAVQAAAEKAGIALKRIAVDDSEFPFLIGVISEPGDFEKLQAQLKTIDGYEYSGSVGDATRHTLSITPSRAYPPETSQSISRRMTLRMQVFYNKFTAEN